MSRGNRLGTRMASVNGTNQAVDLSHPFIFYVHECGMVLMLAFPEIENHCGCRKRREAPTTHGGIESTVKVLYG